MIDCKYPIFKKLINSIFEWLGNPEQKIISVYCDIAESTISNYRNGRYIPGEDNIERIATGLEKYLEENKAGINADELKEFILDFAKSENIEVAENCRCRLKYILRDIVCYIK